MDGRNELSGRILSGNRLYECIIIIELYVFVILFDRKWTAAACG